MRAKRVRNADVLVDVLRGNGYRAIAAEYGISAVRVGQIVGEEWRLRKRKGLLGRSSAVKAFPPPPVRGKVPCKTYLVKVLCERCQWHEKVCSSEAGSGVQRRFPIEGKCEWFKALKGKRWEIPNG